MVGEICTTPALTVHEAAHRMAMRKVDALVIGGRRAAAV
jgi:hypothetical protein